MEVLSVSSPAGLVKVDRPRHSKYNLFEVCGQPLKTACHDTLYAAMGLSEHPDRIIRVGDFVKWLEKGHEQTGFVFAIAHREGLLGRV